MWNDIAVPLSEDEKRILAEIEAGLYQSDPSFSRDLGKSATFSRPKANIRASVFGLVLGLVVMVLALQLHYLLSLAGFLLMLASALTLEGNAGDLTRSGIDSFTRFADEQASKHRQK